MPGRKNRPKMTDLVHSTRPRNTITGGEITLVIHQRGYELWRAGVHASKIRSQLGLTTTQWKWLMQVGDTELPAYEEMVIDEVAAIRSASRRAALEVATGSVDVLRRRMEIAGTANDIVAAIIRTVATSVNETHEVHRARMLPDELSMPGGHEVLNGANSLAEEIDNALRRPAILATLKELRHYCDLGQVADSFRAIYGDVPAARGLYPTRDGAARHEGDPLIALQGDTSERDRRFPPEVVHELIDDMRNWTDDQISAYAQGEDEPAPGAAQAAVIEGD